MTDPFYSPKRRIARAKSNLRNLEVRMVAFGNRQISVVAIGHTVSGGAGREIIL